MYNKEKIKELKEKYPVGTRIKLIEMKNEKYAPDSQSIGVVTHIDDLGNIRMSWDCGSSLAIIPDLDVFEIVKEEE